MNMVDLAAREADQALDSLRMSSPEVAALDLNLSRLIARRAAQRAVAVATMPKTCACPFCEHGASVGNLCHLCHELECDEDESRCGRDHAS